MTQPLPSGGGDDAAMTIYDRMRAIGDVVRAADTVMGLRDEELIAGLANVSTWMEAATSLCGAHTALTGLLALVESARDRVLAAGKRDGAKPN